MKQVQLDQIQDAIVVDEAVSTPWVKVSGLGPVTVAVQLTITDSDTPADAAAQLQGSIDGENAFNIGEDIAISGNGVLGDKDTAVAYAYYRVTFAISSGEFTVAPRFFVYGETL